MANIGRLLGLFYEASAFSVYSKTTVRGIFAGTGGGGVTDIKVTKSLMNRVAELCILPHPKKSTAGVSLII